MVNVYNFTVSLLATHFLTRVEYWAPAFDRNWYVGEILLACFFSFSYNLFCGRWCVLCVADWALTSSNLRYLPNFVAPFLFHTTREPKS